ncbi:MAG TPA: aminopeptidase [Chloroflexota bacterium]|jgi:aminopeptidase|nr:aminopeptidase [Chloroflexota bacterium]
MADDRGVTFRKASGVSEVSAAAAGLDAAAIDRIARAMVEISADVRAGESALVFYDAGAAPLARRLARVCSERGARVLYVQRDQFLEAEVAATCSPRDALRSSILNDVAVQASDVVLIARCSTDAEAFEIVPHERLRLWNQARDLYLTDYRVNHTRWVLTYWPTEKEAAVEGMSYDAYVQLYLRACDQPWREIHAAQERLVEMLNAATTLELAANPRDPDRSRRTHLRMDIGPMRFANSTIDRNFPGAEVFAAPVRDSVEGQLFAAGRYAYDGRTIEDIFLRAERGRIVEARARVGGRELIQILDTDAGARYFGEVALGTNPGLRRRVMNGLLNEKVGGSFHITPGRAYTFSEYEGQTVVVDNGNRSQVHWDIAVPMLPAYGGGAVRLDGREIQRDGRFLDPALAVLNAGLEAA